jgi:hypothetical protein
MNTNLQVAAIENNAVVGHSSDRILPDKGYEVTTLNAVNDAKIHEAPKKERSLVKNIGLFFASPFIALAYVIALPFVGFFMFSKLALEAKAKRGNANA